MLVQKGEIEIPPPDNPDVSLKVETLNPETPDAVETVAACGKFGHDTQHGLNRAGFSGG